MTLLPDGRWRMSSAELTAKVWLNSKNWKLDPTDDRCLIPNFPSCTRRSLETVCKPCGAQSQLGYYCSKFETRVSVSYCTVCSSRGDNEPVQASAATLSEQSNPRQVSESVPDLLGTKPTDS